MLSSPIGLGHSRRDLAIVEALRTEHPDVRVRWLAQDPVTRVLEAAGEQVHPASAWLASESAHVEAECGEHDLDAFDAIRRMDDILVNNFMVLDEVLREEHVDLVVGDEAWETDHFLHENPELKRGAFAWLTDFVGWLPMPAGGERQACLTADYNAEMLEHRERFPWVRDRSVFVGTPDDVVPDAFGPGLPSIRGWTEAEFDFAGYVSGFTPPGEEERARPARGPRLARRRDRVRRRRGRHRRRARPCCGGCSTRCPRPDGPGRTCASSSWPARGSTRGRCRSRAVPRCSASCPTSGGSSRRATWPSCRAGSRPAWS